MWPWEHLAIGYLAYAVVRRVLRHGPPTAGVAVAVAFGSQFPDLVDKPLAWVFGVLPAGTTLAHSALTAVPLSLLVLVAGYLAERERPAVAFVVGYLSHLPADALYPVVLGDGPMLSFLLWPLRPVGGGPVEAGPYVFALFEQFVAFLATPLGLTYLFAELVLLAAAVWAWSSDGRPGLTLLAPRTDRAEKL